MVRVLKSTAASVLSHHQLVGEIQQTCAPRQRALLSLLAICDKHQLAPAPLIASFADDLPRTPLESRRKTRKFYWSRVHDFAEELQHAQAIPAALEKFPGLLPRMVEIALRLEREGGTLDEFTDAWLSRPPDYICDASRNRTSVNTMFTLFVKTFVIFMVAIFILINIFPKFESMMAEFAVEPPPIFNFTAMICDVLLRAWLFPVLLILIAMPFCIPALSRYFKRWNPFVWRQPIWPRSVARRQVLALLTDHGKSISADALAGLCRRKRSIPLSASELEATNNKPFDWKQLAARGIISNKEAKALQSTNSPATQAWLLQKSAVSRVDRIESRRMMFVRAVVITMNVILGMLVLLTALSIFSMLITIMSSLQ